MSGIYDFFRVRSSGFGFLIALPGKMDEATLITEVVIVVGNSSCPHQAYMTLGNWSDELIIHNATTSSVINYTPYDGNSACDYQFNLVLHVRETSPRTLGLSSSPEAAATTDSHVFTETACGFKRRAIPDHWFCFVDRDQHRLVISPITRVATSLIRKSGGEVTTSFLAKHLPNAMDNGTGRISFHQS